LRNTFLQIKLIALAGYVMAGATTLSWKITAAEWMMLFERGKCMARRSSIKGENVANGPKKITINHNEGNHDEKATPNQYRCAVPGNGDGAR